MPINIVVIEGTVVAAPKLRKIPTGTVADFRIVQNVDVKKKEGYVSVPMYYDVEAFGNPATFLADHLAVGMDVVVSGKLRHEVFVYAGRRREKYLILLPNATAIHFDPSQLDRVRDPDRSRPGPAVDDVGIIEM